jgi:hypothetical protein
MFYLENFGVILFTLVAILIFFMREQKESPRWTKIKPDNYKSLSVIPLTTSFLINDESNDQNGETMVSPRLLEV